MAQRSTVRSNVDIAELEARLREAEETLEAIRRGDVDAIAVSGPAGEQVYTLKSADRSYRALVEQMQEGAITLSSEGVVFYCNKRFATMVDTPPEKIVGEVVSRFFGEAETRLLLRLLANSGDEGASGEFTLRPANGVEIPVNISLADLKSDDEMPGVVCCIVTDLTHTIRRSHELAAANAKLAREIDERLRVEDSLQLTLEAAGMASWDLDLQSGMMRRSLHHDQIFGHSSPLSTWQLQTSLDHFLPDDRDAVETAFVTAAASGRIDLERRIRRTGDGAIRWLHMKGRTYYHQDKPVRLAGIAADVTERRDVEAQLRQAQKMEALGQLTGGIAHDFNNLLTIILGNLETMQRRLGRPDVDIAAISKLAENATIGGQQAASLTQRLLAFSRRQPLEPKSLDANTLVTGMLDLLRRTLGEHIVIEPALAADLWHTHADPNQLESAILNLAINARDAMPDGGVMTIETANAQLGERNLARQLDIAAGPYVLIAIADTGSGMSKEVLSHAFEPFFTTKDTGQGTGLGLAQVYGFVKQSGGHAKIESKPGSGTTVRIYLPRFDEPAREAEPPTTEALPLEGRAETILLVDDDEGVRRHSTSILLEMGYRVLGAVDGKSALEIVDKQPDIDLLFTDVGLPGGMNGKQLADEARRRNPKLRVLFTSGYARSAIMRDDRLDADVQLVSKPFTYRALARKIRELLDQDLNAP